jgi:DNA/RNA endonuclease YhcR with UshA esterase domain
MKNKIFSFTAYCLTALFLVGGISGCVKHKFDEPPIAELPSLTATHTLADLLARHTIGTSPDLIADSVILEAIIVADDQTGNFYKNMVIQDGTAGVQVRVDATSFYVNYPIKRKLWIKAKNLYIGDYNGVPQISFNAAGDGIPQALLPQYLVGGERNQTVIPAIKTVSQLGDSDLNTLVQIDSAQFAAIDMLQPYADGVARLSLNRTIETCDGSSIIVRTSGYADFANTSTPQGKGSIVAVYSKFGTTKQLYIRTPDDAQMSATRCGLGGDPITVGDLRAAFTGAAVLAPRGVITALVISDKNAGNFDTRTLIVQDATGGMTFRLDAAHNANVGDEIQISVGGDSIKLYNGLVQTYASAANVVVMSSGNILTPRIATIADVIANASAWQSTLIQIQNGSLSGGSTFSGSRTLNDGTGTITLYTRSAANFATAAIPTGNLSFTKGVLSDFNGLQLLMRDISDVSGGVTPTYLFQETFSTAAANSAISLSGWTNVATQGSTLWQGKVYSNNYYAQMSAYSTSQPSVETWLVTPAINLTANAFLSFETARAFAVPSTLTAYISTNFTGNVTTATWTQLSATIAQLADTQYAFIPSGDVDLSAYTGQNVYVAFKYVGGDNSATMTYRIDNVQVRLQ